MTFKTLILACALMLPAAGAQGQSTLTIRGLGGTTAVVTNADLSKLPSHTIKTLDHGSPATFQGVLLKDVIAKVSLPLGEKYHGTAASYYLLAEGKDGYKALYAWAELDAGFMDKPVYVVTMRDGKPLPDNAKPFQLVAPGEKRGARWIRQVTSLTIRQAN